MPRAAALRGDAPRAPLLFCGRAQAAVLLFVLQIGFVVLSLAVMLWAASGRRVPGCGRRAQIAAGADGAIPSGTSGEGEGRGGEEDGAAGVSKAGAAPSTQAAALAAPTTAVERMRAGGKPKATKESLRVGLRDPEVAQMARAQGKRREKTAFMGERERGTALHPAVEGASKVDEHA